MKRQQKASKRYPLIPETRYSNDPRSVTNFFGDTKIILEIKATKEHWDLLWDYFEKNGVKKIGSALLSSFLSPSQVKLHDKENYKDGKKDFVQNMQMLSGILYQFFFYCLRKYKNNLPVHIKEIENDKLLKEAIQSVKRSDVAILYTAYFIQVIYGEFLERFSIKPFFAFDEETINQDLESFRIKYIQVGKNFIKNNYDDVIIFWCYTCLIGFHFPNCKVFRENQHIKNLFDVLYSAFLYQGDREKVKTDVICIHNILLEIFPWLTDIKNILARLRRDNPCINETGSVTCIPPDEITPNRLPSSR